MPSALHAEHARICAALEAEVGRLGVLAALPLQTLVVELWALGAEWEDALNGLVALLEKQNAERDEAA